VFPSVTQEDQALIYGDHYFARGGDWVCGCYEGGYAEAEPRLRIEARKILTMLPDPPGRLLDIGCAGGTFLDEAHTRGFDVVGIELNPAMAQHARTTYQLEVQASRIEDVPPDQWAGQFDGVTLLDVLEHVPAPAATLRKVAQWVRPGGFVFIRGPLSNSRTAHLKEHIRRAFRLTKQLPGYPLDANMFNKQSLSALLEASGFAGPAWMQETPTFANLLAQRRAPTWSAGTPRVSGAAIPHSSRSGLG
jgi:SAM-dependent methyltransferase